MSILIARSGKAQNSGYPLANYMTKLRNLTNGERFSAFPLSLHLMFDQTLSNIIVCMMISHKKNCIQKLHKHVAVDTK